MAIFLYYIGCLGKMSSNIYKFMHSKTNLCLAFNQADLRRLQEHVYR